MLTRTATATAVALLITAALSSAAFAQRGDDSQRKSKNGHSEGEIDGVAVAIDYGRPNVSGRAVWGTLVPNGAIWRAGADEATTIRFDKDVAIEGQPLAAGTYALFMIPTEGNWTLIFNKVAKQWGAFKHDASQDALRVEVAPRSGDPIEALDYVIQGDEVMLRWEKKVVPFRIAASK